MHKRVSGHGGAFRVLAPIYPYSFDPSLLPLRPMEWPVFWSTLRPVPFRNTTTYQVVKTDKGAKNINARVAPTTTPILNPAEGYFTVNDNDFTTGRAVLHIGDYELISHLDFAVGVGVNATAANIAAAVSKLPGFTGQNVGPVVHVFYDAGPMDVVEFRAAFNGMVTNFTTFVPDNGQLAMGSPSIVAPLLA